MGHRFDTRRPGRDVTRRHYLLLALLVLAFCVMSVAFLGLSTAHAGSPAPVSGVSSRVPSP
ncbi:MAG: hypothetical protein NVS3B21_00750 [Acidimicrobiales bacterium]